MNHKIWSLVSKYIIFSAREAYEESRDKKRPTHRIGSLLFGTVVDSISYYKEQVDALNLIYQLEHLPMRIHLNPPHFLHHLLSCPKIFKKEIKKIPDLM